MFIKTLSKQKRLFSSATTNISRSSDLQDILKNYISVKSPFQRMKLLLEYSFAALRDVE